jgi:diguanylate cyclase (GGDEF)-like protein
MTAIHFFNEVFGLDFLMEFVLIIWLVVSVRRSGRVIAANQEELSRLREDVRTAHQDVLTRLPDSYVAIQAINNIRRQASCATIAFCDVNGLKHINDTLGHEVGDEMIKAAGRRLHECLAAVGMVARIGGDEFLVIVPEVRDISTLLDQVCDPSLAIGVADTNVCATVDNTIACADAAMYRSKRERIPWCRWSPETDPQPVSMIERRQNAGRRVTDRLPFLRQSPPRD